MKRSVVTRSVRRSGRFTAPSIPKARPAAVQVFLFRSESFLGTELFDVTGPVTIGRSLHSGLRLEGDSVSRQHCRLIYVSGEIWIEDLGSSNGTYVNRRRADRRIALEPTDSIHIGRYTLKVRALHAIPARLSEEGATEAVTRQEALLTVETSGVERDEPVIDLGGGLDRKLYEAAVRRATDGVAAQSVNADQPSANEESVAETSSASALVEARLKPAPIGEKIGQKIGEKLSELSRVPLRVVPPKSGSEGVRIDPDVEARLRDLDELIAALDEKQKGGRDLRALHAVEGLLGKNPAAGPDGSRTARSAIEAPALLGASFASEAQTEERSHTGKPSFDASALPSGRRMSTVEFARDLASRLAVAGQVLGVGAAAKGPPAIGAPVTAHGAPGPLPVSMPPLPQLSTGSPPQPLPPPPLLASTASKPSAKRAPPPLPRPAGVPKAPLKEALRDETPTAKDPDDPIQEWREEYVRARTEVAQLPRHDSRPPRSDERARDVTFGAAVNDRAESFEDVWTGASRVEPVSVRAAIQVQSKGGAPSARVSRPSPPVAKPSAPASRPSAPVSRSSVPVSRSSVPVSKVIAPAMKPTAVQRAPQTAASVDGVVPRQGGDEMSLATERQTTTTGYFDSIEIAARARGKLIDVAHLSREGEQYILGHRTPRGSTAPASAHAGLRMLRINADRSVDLVFPRDVAGHLVRGSDTVMFGELTEARKYSCLRLEARDIATVILGEGGRAISYHISFDRKGGSRSS